jgi:hypothetical protein
VFSSWDDAREIIRGTIYNASAFYLNATCEYDFKDYSRDPLMVTFEVMEEDRRVTLALSQTDTRNAMRGLEETSFKQHAALLPDNTTMAIVMAPSGSFLKEKYLSFCDNKQTSNSEILYSDCFTSTTDLGK